MAEAARRRLVITGLELHTARNAPLFWRHAFPAMAQARQDPGCLFADARRIGRVHFTVTLWRDAAAASAYGRSGAHARAAALTDRLGHGKVYWGSAEAAPDWETAERLWQEHAQIV